MDFYTSVEKLGDNILYVGYEDNVRIRKQAKYQPTVFVPTRKKTEYRTLLGLAVAPVKPGGMRETRDYVEHNSVSNQKISLIIIQFQIKRYMVIQILLLSLFQTSFQMVVSSIEIKSILLILISKYNLTRGFHNQTRQDTL